MKNFFHLLRIARVLVKYSLDDMIGELSFFRPYVFLFRFIPGSRKAKRDLPRGERLCLALEELGPVFIKFGQVLSTRPDLLPMDIASSLTRLQDRVPPFPGDEAKSIIEEAFGDSLDQHFSQFDREPAASASVAQVHYAQLLDGTDVVVKVLRPGIEEIVEKDLRLLHALAELVERYWSEGKRLKPIEVVEDYHRTIHDEFDLKREAANASQLKINFEDSDLIYVPAIYWEHTHQNVMVMERIYGISIRDVETIKASGIDMCKLAHDGVEIFFTQAFQHGFFHADMHPGNIFVAPDGQYRAVDFGIMGTLSTSDKRYLAENLLAFFNRDYHRVADAHIRAGWVPPETNVEDFEGAIRTVCEPIFARPISEISFGSFLIDLFRVARRYQMPVQPQLVLLQKTLLNIEGLGRQLYPDLDLWDTAKPFLEKWMNEQIGPRAALKTLKRELPNLYTLAPELPAITHQLLYRVKNNEMIFETRDQEIALLRTQLKKQQTRTIQLIFGLGLLMMSILLLPDHQDMKTMPILGWVLGGTGASLLLMGALGFSEPGHRE
ncbi:MAG: ubiquinone biosynthesis regulatory protein kinase UbiB [Gammaproteobacteria bacterium]|nr:ubiquinone biosynthesis regulatory protein kinase UbiB [Gammaproteobacteria bacterium]NKB63977.1 ubiquinone biosynthesis regulatory protein kinase UbiB [Gammaproteobacteria bacterium]